MATLIVLRYLPRALVLLGAVALGVGTARAAAPQEVQVKAAYMFHFVQFSGWPPEAFTSPDEPFVVGVLGDDPFGQHLDEAVAGEELNGHPMIVRRFQRVEDIDRCHLLYIAGNETRRLGQIMPALVGRPILTVGETEGFWRAAGMIRFVTVQNRVRFHINHTAAKHAQLSLSAKLLRAAEHVE